MGKRVGRICSVGDPVATGCECKHRKCNTSTTHACFQTRTSLRVAASGKHKKPGKFEIKQIEGEGGERWAKMLSYICHTIAHSLAAELPTPKSRICLISHLCRHIKAGVWDCVREMVCAVSPSHHVFQRFPSTHHTNSESKGIIRIKDVNIDGLGGPHR